MLRVKFNNQTPTLHQLITQTSGAFPRVSIFRFITLWASNDVLEHRSNPLMHKRRTTLKWRFQIPPSTLYLPRNGVSTLFFKSTCSHNRSTLVNKLVWENLRESLVEVVLVFSRAEVGLFCHHSFGFCRCGETWLGNTPGGKLFESTNKQRSSHGIFPFAH